MDATDMQLEIRNYIAKTAEDWPHFVELAEDSDPDLAASLKSKALVGSKSVWAPLATWAVSMAVSYYGLAWDSSTCAMLSSLLAYLVTVAVRCHVFANRRDLQGAADGFSRLPLSGNGFVCARGASESGVIGGFFGASRILS